MKDLDDTPMFESPGENADLMEICEDSVFACKEYGDKKLNVLGRLLRESKQFLRVLEHQDSDITANNVTRLVAEEG